MTSLSGVISLKKLILSFQKPSISNSVLARGGTLWVPRFSTLGFLSGLILWRTYASCCNHCELIGATVLLWLFPCSPPLSLPLIIVWILYPWLSLRLGSKRSAMDAPLTAEHVQFYSLYVEQLLFLTDSGAQFLCLGSLQCFLLQLNVPMNQVKSREGDAAPLSCFPA